MKKKRELSKLKQGKQLAREFDFVIAMATAKVYSKLSLERQLSASELAKYKEAMSVIGITL